MLFSAAITEYCFNYNVSKLSSKTISNYQKQLKYLQRYMAQVFKSKQLSSRSQLK